MPNPEDITNLIQRAEEQVSDGSTEEALKSGDLKTAIGNIKRMEELNAEIESLLWPQELTEFTKERTIERIQEELEFISSLTLQNGESVVENGKLKAEYSEDGKEHTLPTEEEILDWIKENKDTIANREKLGFTPESMQITPFALKIDVFKDIYGKVILEKHKQDRLLGQNDDVLGLDESEPVWIVTEVEYKEMRYDISSKTPEGISKLEYIERHGAFQIVFTPDFKHHELFKDENGNSPNTNDIPRSGDYADKYLNKNPGTLLTKLESAKETDSTQDFAIPEDVMMAHITHLEKTDHVLGDCEANGTVTVCPTTKTVFGGVPWVDWHRAFLQSYWGWYGIADTVDAGSLSAVRGDLK